MKFTFKYKWLVGTLFIWAIIFAVPSLRYHLQVMTEGSPWIRFTVIPNNYWEHRFDEYNPELPIKVEAIKSGDTIYGSPSNLKILNPIDDIIHEHPDVPWLIALRLWMTMRLFQGDRVGGELSDPDRKERIKEGILSPEKVGKINFTKAQMGQALELCKRGEKLEPQNAYFTWVRVYFLMLNWQDKKAFEALQEAAAKTYWNNHKTDYVLDYASASQKLLGRKLLPLEASNINLLYDDYGLLPRIYEMGRILAWQGIKLKRQGESQKALELWGNLYHTMTLSSQGAAQVSNFMMNDVMLAFAEMGATYPSREVQNRKRLTAEQRKNGFIVFANKYHRPELAQRCERDWQVNHDLLQKTRDYTTGLVKHFPRLFFLILISGLLLTVGVILVGLLLGALLTWCILECYRILTHHKSTFTPNDNSMDCWNRFKGIVACSGLPSFVLGMGFLIGIIYFITFFISDNLQSNLYNGWSLSNILIHTSDTTFLNSLLERMGNIFNNNFSPPMWRGFLFFTPLVCGMFYALHQNLLKSRNDNTSVWRHATRSLHLILLFLAWGILVFTIEYDPLQTIFALICVLFLVFSFLRMFRKSRGNYLSVLSFLQSSLVGWICTASILIFILLTAQTALNNNLQPWGNNQFHGEMHLLHHVADSPP